MSLEISGNRCDLCNSESTEAVEAIESAQIES